MVGGVWNGFLLGRVRDQPVPCRFCGALDSDAHVFWECSFPPPLVDIRENPEFHGQGSLAKMLALARMASCAFLCHGAPPWAADASESAGHLLEVALGSYSYGMVSEWSVPEGFDAVETASRMPDVPNVWTDGVWLWTRLLVSPPLALGSLLNSLDFAGDVEGPC